MRLSDYGAWVHIYGSEDLSVSFRLVNWQQLDRLFHGTLKNNITALFFYNGLGCDYRLVKCGGSFGDNFVSLFKRHKRKEAHAFWYNGSDFGFSQITDIVPELSVVGEV